VVEVDVAQQQVADVAELEVVVGEARLQRVDRRRRPAVEDRRSVVRVEDVGADAAGPAVVMKVDRLDDVILRSA
jgi:hypothetical protein